MGRMIVATPAAKTKVIPRMRLRRWKPLAKYAGSMTDTQHGASSATTPPKKAAITVLEVRSWDTGDLRVGPASGPD